jgi:co-chaperonin GroES (HSP10)
MYQAINEHIICKRKGEQTTNSGIIVADTKGLTCALEVVATTDVTKDLQGKTIYVEGRMANRELPSNGDGNTYVSVPLKEVIAVV